TPKVERDETLPDLGFHYAALDMVFGSVLFTNSSILLTNGAAIGVYMLSPATYGIGLGDNARMFSESSPTNLTRIVRYNCVQEQANTNWSAHRGPSIAATPTTVVTAPQARFRFTDWSVTAQDTEHFYGYNQDVDYVVPFIDCQFHGGKFHTDRPGVNVTNCLFERVAVNLENYATFDLNFRHNTFVGGTNYLLYFTGGTWTFKDNLFDGTLVDTNAPGYTGDYNAYTTNLARLPP